jgi:hypothetical protein
MSYYIFFRDYFSQDFQTHILLAQKSNAGERISKFFVEKKIFYSLDFLAAAPGKINNDFFIEMVKKYFAGLYFIEY